MNMKETLKNKKIIFCDLDGTTKEAPEYYRYWED